MKIFEAGLLKELKLTNSVLLETFVGAQLVKGKEKGKVVPVLNYLRTTP
jgi:hypothetical protein